MIQQPIILFDGVCNFCNNTVNFVIKKDKNSTIKFAALQSKIGKQILQQFNLPINNINSIIFIENEKIFTKSTGVLKVCRYLNGGWRILYLFIYFPKMIRDIVYDWIAKNRYKWFGKKTVCMVPSEKIKSRFLDEANFSNRSI